MSIQFNMPYAQNLAQEGFVWGISNSDGSGSGGGCREIEKQLPPPQPAYLLETPTAKAAQGKKRAERNDNNHPEESHDHEIHIWTERERRKKMSDMFSKLHALLPQLPSKADKSTIVDEAVDSIQKLKRTLEKLQMQKLEKLHCSSASNTTFAYAPSSSSSPTTLLTPISNHPQMLTVGATATDSYSREAFLADQISFSNAATMNLPYPCNDQIMAFDTWSSRNVVLNICGNEAFFNFCCPKDKSGVFTSVCYLFEKYNIEVLFANVSTNVFRSTYIIQAQVNPTYESQILGNGFGVGEIFKQAAQELVLYVSSP